MTQLARCQFFFLGNLSLRSTARSCGSQLKLVQQSWNKSSGKRRIGVLGFGSIRGLEGLNSVGRSKSPPSARQFSTAAGRAAGSDHGLFSKPKYVKTLLAAYTKNGSTHMYSEGSPWSETSYSVSGSTQNPTAVPNNSTSTDSMAGTKSNLNLYLDKSGRPLMSPKYVGYWLLFTAGLVFGIVVIGGLTRLTESGLSITEWKPVTGSIPPLNREDWEREFALYRNSPEFEILNSNMTLEEFKFIYFMEWIHRLWGRAIGLAVVLPAVYFAVSRKTSAHTNKRLALISILIGLQGVLGWWMVKSGLDQDFLNQPGSHPRVSQYRLTAHLGAAFLVYIAMLTTGISIIREARWTSSAAAAQSALTDFATVMTPALRRFRGIMTPLVVLVFVTAMSGGFVAGLDAGLIYNSFPYMGESLAPPKSELLDPNYASDKSSSFNVFWKNMLENPVTVQFNHRVLAVTTFSTILGMHLYSIVLKRQQVLPRQIFKTGAKAMLFVTLQAALGISTLVYVVPISLAAAHQAGSLAVLTSVLVLASRLKLPRAEVRKLLEKMARGADKKKFE